MFVWLFVASHETDLHPGHTYVTCQAKCTSRMLRNSVVLNVMRMAAGAGVCSSSKESVTVITAFEHSARNDQTLRWCDKKCEYIWNMNFI